MDKRMEEVLKRFKERTVKKCYKMELLEENPAVPNNRHS